MIGIFGADSFEGAQRGLRAGNLSPVALAKFDRAKPDFRPIAAQINEARAQAVLLLGTGAAVVEGYAAFRAAGSRAQIATLSNNASGGFIQSLGPNAHGAIVTQVYPSERSGQYRLVREAQQLAKAKGQEVSPAMLEGIAAAKVLVEGLTRAGPNPSCARIHAALEGIRQFDLGGTS